LKKTFFILPPTTRVGLQPTIVGSRLRLFVEPFPESVPLAQERLVTDIERRFASEWGLGSGDQEVAAGLPKVFHHFGHDLNGQNWARDL
jgi:hypothetical protein